MKKKLKWIGLVTIMVVYLMLFTMPVAHAYIDPSATTYLIQAVAGIAIAVGSVAVIFWRRAKKKLKEKAGIDLDKNKETEASVMRVDSSDNKQNGKNT